MADDTHALLEFEPDHARILDQRGVARIVDTLSRGSPNLTTIHDGRRFRPTMSEVEGGLDLVPDQLLELQPEHPMRLHFLLHGASFELEGAVEPGPNRIRLRPEFRIFSANRRTRPRLALSGLVRFGGLGGPTGTLVDISPTGFRAEVSRDAAPYVRGFGWAELDVRARETFEGYARLRRRVDYPTRSVLGFEFEPRHERADMARALLRHAFPSIRPRHTVHPELVRRLFEDSGYLDLRTRAFPPDWSNFESPDSFDVVYSSEEGLPIAHLSLTRAFSTTWIVHQFASRSRHPESFRSWFELYRVLSLMPLLADGSAAYALAYYNPLRPWHLRYLGAFERWMASEDDVVMSQVDRFELDASGGPAPVTVDGYSVGRMRNDERARCHAVALSNMPPLVGRAMDMSPTTLDTPTLTSSGDSRLDRSREVLVLRRGEHIAAIAMCERGHPSASLFGLFDMVHLLPSRDSAPPPKEALRLLIESVRTHYRSKRIDTPILAAPIATLADGDHPALKYVESMGRFVMSARALRHYENFVLYTFGKAAAIVQRKVRWKAA